VSEILTIRVTMPGNILWLCQYSWHNPTLGSSRDEPQKRWRTRTGDAEPTQVIGLSVTAAFFETLGVRPILGRTFTADEDGRYGHPRSC